MNKPITATRKWVLPSAKNITEKAFSLETVSSEKLKSEQKTQQKYVFDVNSTELELSECLKDPM